MINISGTLRGKSRHHAVEHMDKQRNKNSKKESKGSSRSWTHLTRHEECFDLSGDGTQQRNYK
jgi:hypothetical protein